MVKSGFSRKPQSLTKLLETMHLAPQGSDFALQSSDPNISIQKKRPTGNDLAEMIKAAQSGNQSIHDLLVTGLVELCKVKPVGIDSVKWLGEWLIANNPNKPRVESEGSDE